MRLLGYSKQKISPKKAVSPCAECVTFSLPRIKLKLSSGVFEQIYRLHANEKKRSYSRRVLDIEHGSFTPLVFTSTGGMCPECLRFHSRLAELIADKKGEHYSRTISWIRARTSFALLRSALICLRGSRTIRRRKMDLTNADIDIQNSEAAIL